MIDTEETAWYDYPRFLIYRMGNFTPQPVHVKTVPLEISPEQNFTHRFAALKEAVLLRKPVLRDILQKHGNKSLCDYALDYFDVNEGPGLINRREEFLTTFKSEVSRLLGDTVAVSAVEQLRKYYFVSTADHHGPICDPYFLSSNLVTTITAFFQKDPVLKNVIALSCGSVSVDNDTFPRGLTFTSSNHNELHVNRLPFFSSHERPSLICRLRAYGASEIDKIKKTVHDLVKNNSISLEQSTTILGLIDEVYNTPENLAASSYSDQITKTNYDLWQKIFAKTKQGQPNLIYLELENTVARLLIDHHLYQDTMINHLLFDRQYQELIMKYFDGIIGAFSSTDNSGSYLFWGVPAGARYRVRLMPQGTKLVSDDGMYSIELTPDAIGRALKNKEIIPGMMLDFMVLSLYYGLKCLGGFSQVNYLTEMKQAYIKMHTELGNQQEVILCEPVQTKELGEDLTIAYVTNSVGRVAMATGLDLILYGIDSTWECLVREAKDITLEQAVNPMFPSFYRVAYHESERQEDLLSISSKDIVAYTGLQQHIRPCVKIPD